MYLPGRGWHEFFVTAFAAKLQKTGDLYTYKTEDIMLSKAIFSHVRSSRLSDSI